MFSGGLRMFVGLEAAGFWELKGCKRFGVLFSGPGA